MIDCTSLADQELLQLMRQDNALAFQELYLRYWDRLFYLSHKRLKSATAAEEIVQDAFLILWQKRKDLVIESLPQYLSAMTRYAVYRYLANEKRSTAQKGLFGRQSKGISLEELAVDTKLIMEMVKKVSSKLPEKCRLVFVYNKIEDESLPDVARRLNISLKTAEAHLTKALRIIRMSIKL
jgi:RNA polymerase sigma-19 factor, ECF subfamily